jgi:hypothetical protein
VNLDSTGKYSVSTRLTQRARLERDPGNILWVSTWTHEESGDLKMEKGNGMRFAVKHSLDRMINDWTVANASATTPAAPKR